MNSNGKGNRGHSVVACTDAVESMYRYSIQAFKKEADKLENIEFELIEKTVVLEKRKTDLKEVSTHKSRNSL